ncbi:hypothetical protein DPMN_032153 [Dreissena polymorpha]|uniref:Uncharacterized protein n=1 Tax=Dreissena polymorpha TaxID=45954 RepID=A0A9D4RJS2_DREPO|nr:hypothetical protein DPMN_032153 [Dreissena polymorpha]
MRATSTATGAGSRTTLRVTARQVDVTLNVTTAEKRANLHVTVQRFRGTCLR